MEVEAAARQPADVVEHRRVELLLRAGLALAESLDADLLLDRVARLVVPDLADWCVIHLSTDDGIEVGAVAHADPAKVEPLRELHLRHAPDGEATAGVAEVIRTGQPELYVEVPGDLLPQGSEEVGLGATSAIIVPLIARGRVLGTITLAAIVERRAYDDADLALARAVAFRGALSIDNATLFKQVQDAGLRYRTLVQSVDAIVWEAETDPLRFTFVSQRAERILGYPVGRWLEPGFWESIVHPDDRDLVVELFRKAATTGQDHDFEYRATSADGRIVWLRDLVYVEERDATHLRGIMVDVTGRRAADRRRAAHLAATRTLAEATTLPEAARRILEDMGDALDWDAGAMWHVDQSAGVLRCIETWTRPSAARERFSAVTRASVFRPGIGLPGRVWSTGGPLWVSDVTVDDNFPRASVAAADGLHGALAFPVLSRGSVAGVVEFFSRSIEQPDDELMAMMSIIGTEIGTFIERKWAEEEIRFQKALLESQNETTIDGILVLATDGVTILSANKRFAELWGIDEALLKPGQNAAELGGIFEQFEEPEEVAREVAEIFQQPDAVGRREIRLADGRIVDRYTAPIYSTDDRNYGRAWYFRDVTDRVRTQRQLAAAKERNEFLAEASAVFSASMDTDSILGSLARLAVPFLADWCIVDIFGDDDLLRRVAVTHAQPEAADAAAFLATHTGLDPEKEGAVGRVLASGLAEIESELSSPTMLSGDADAGYAEVVRGLGITSYMCVPLIARGRTIGAITFAAGASGRRFGPGDLVLAEDVARRAALAVDNARLYRDQAHIARVLQASLLPPDLPAIPGVEVAASYHASGEGTDVGGDFYDVFRTGAGDWAVVIGDVCGKGADAAALTALVRYTVRAAAMQARKPKRVLATLNEAILEQRHEREFCTIAYARLRPGEAHARLTISCGGHPLPLLLRAGGAVEVAGKPGSLLGVFEEPDLSDTVVDLAAGDALVLYTDGVTEARAPDGTFGDHILPEALAACAGMPAHEICKRIERAVLDFQAGRPRDDVALVVLRVQPTGFGLRQ